KKGLHRLSKVLAAERLREQILSLEQNLAAQSLRRSSTTTTTTRGGAGGRGAGGREGGREARRERERV
ncbi:hypothetical protein HK102_012972, partial [Quaeritorhiza haematococci]